MSTNYYDLDGRVLMLVQTSGGVARVRIGPDPTSNKPSIYTGYAVYKSWRILSDEPEVTLYDGAGRTHEPEVSPLSHIIERLNERFGLKLTEADRLHLDSIAQDFVDNETVQRQAAANTRGNFGVQFPQHFEKAVVDRLAGTEDFSYQLLDNDELSEQVRAVYLPLVYGKAKVAWQEHCPIGELLGPPPKEDVHWSTSPRSARARTPESSSSRSRRRV
jgi:hypothetical protein